MTAAAALKALAAALHHAAQTLKSLGDEAHAGIADTAGTKAEAPNTIPSAETLKDAVNSLVQALLDIRIRQTDPAAPAEHIDEARAPISNEPLIDALKAAGVDDTDINALKHA